MIRLTASLAALAGAVTLLPPAVGAQEKPKPKQRVVRAMRLVSGSTQKKSQKELQALLAEKVAMPWVKKSPWITDFAAAQSAAEAKGQPIFAYFTRSYAP